MRRTHKLLITLAVIGAATLLIAWNTSAQEARPAMSVTDAKRDAAALETREIAVRGTVDAASIVANGTLVESFVIVDGSEQLKVEFHKPPPDNFGPKDVVVNGRVQRQPDGAVVLFADSIQVGCSSKY